MTNRLADAVSPYLRSHAENPVDWWPWGEEAFAEAARRDVPVMISIGYATCHWCHVMARESFSDPEVAAYLNENLVAIKVDREEHPGGRRQLPRGGERVHAEPGLAADGVRDAAGCDVLRGHLLPAARGRRRARVPAGGRCGARGVAGAASRRRARRGGRARGDGGDARRPTWPSAALTREQFDAAVAKLESLEDPEFGGLGRAPKFPNTPVIAFLLERGAAGDERAEAFARRTLATMAASGLRDPVEGGFFRYAVQRDWTEPHYERMLSDNAQLLAAYTAVAVDDQDAAQTAEGLVAFLLGVLRLPERAPSHPPRTARAWSTAPPARAGTTRSMPPARAGQPRPALDAKVLTGLNGIAIGALADAGARFERAEWVDAARAAADAVLALHGDDARDRPRLARRTALGRARDPRGPGRAGRGTAPAGAGERGGALRRGRAHARRGVRRAGRRDRGAGRTRPGARRPRPRDRGRPRRRSPAIRSLAARRRRAAALVADRRRRAPAHRRGRGRSRALVCRRPAERVRRGAGRRIPARGTARAARDRRARTGARESSVPPRAAGAAACAPIVTPAQAEAFAAAGFELFASRGARDGLPTAYYCEHFVCALPVTTAERADGAAQPASVTSSASGSASHSLSESS